MTEKRKRITDKILEIIGYLDNKENYNVKKYTEILNSLSDEDFGKFCNWCNDPNDLDQVDHTLIVQLQPFEEPDLANIYKALEALNVPAEEYIWFDVNSSGERIRTRYRVPVGYVHVKRLEQMTSKKNKYTLNNDKRNIKTGQVSGDSKVVAISGDEAAGLLTQIDADSPVFKELYGARSQDDTARNKLYKDIALNGYASIDDVIEDSTLDTKYTLNTLNTYLLSAGLRSDLVNNSLKTAYTIKKDLGGK